MSGRRFRLAAVEILVPVVAVLALGFATASNESVYFPPLLDVFERFEANWLFERFESDVVPSMLRLFGGFASALVVGVSLGVVLGLSRRARIATSPIVEFLRATPAPALLPFSILVLGIGNGMKVFLIALTCLFPILLNTIDGVRGVEPLLNDTARAYRMSRRLRIRKLVLPAAMPQIFAGMRTSMSLALVLMVISEMVASTNGIGFFVLQSQRTFAIADMWSGILLLGLLGYLLNSSLQVIERRVLGWHRGAMASALSQ